MEKQSKIRGAEEWTNPKIGFYLLVFTSFPPHDRSANLFANGCKLALTVDGGIDN